MVAWADILYQDTPLIPLFVGNSCRALC